MSFIVKLLGECCERRENHLKWVNLTWGPMGESFSTVIPARTKYGNDAD